MEDNQNIPQAPDFSDIPSLGDTSGLEAYLNNQALAASGVQPVQPTEPAQQPAAAPTQPAQPVAQATQPAAQTPATPASGAQQGGSITLTQEQLNAILASRGQLPQPTKPIIPNQGQARSNGYTVQEQQFISRALAQGYSLTQINDFLTKQRSGGVQGTNPEFEQRISQVEKYLQEQAYKASETAFISKLSNFGEKWGLSEQDLVTFGQEALKNGINIAMENVNLETVFRAIYPDQYAIRSRRMSPTNSSQIYGGTSIPEGSRAQASKLEDAYVESFLKGAMPTQYGMLNKK